MDCVRVACFSWTGRNPENIPKQYDEMLKNSQDSDLNSFASYCGRSEAIRHEISRIGDSIPLLG